METISMHQNMGFSVVWARLEDVADALEYLPQCEKWSLDGAYGRPHPPLTKNFLTYGYVADVARLGSCGLDLETEVVGVLPLHDRYVVYRVANDGRLHPVEVPTYEDAIGVANEWFNCYEVGGTEGMEDPTSLLASVGTDAILRREREGTIAQQVERRRLREITGPWMEEEPVALRLLRPDAYRFNDQYLTVETSDIRGAKHLRELLTPIFAGVEFTVTEFAADASLNFFNPTLVTMSHSGGDQSGVARLRTAEVGQLVFNPLLRPIDWLHQEQADGMWISYVNIERPLGEAPFFESALGIPKWVVERWADTKPRSVNETATDAKWWAVSFPQVGTSVIIPTEGAVLEASNRGHGRWVWLEAKENDTFRRHLVEDHELAAANLDLLDPNQEPVDVESRHEDALAEIRSVAAAARRETPETPETQEISEGRETQEN